MKRLILLLLLLLLVACSGKSKNETAGASYNGLPPGITLNPHGTLIGTPTGSPGVYTFTVTVTDASNPPQTATKVLSMNIYQVGDVNTDFGVNVLDQILVGQNFSATGTPGWIPEDVNRDGVINVLDMIIVGQHFGE